MFLKYIEITGFKSFADRVKLEFHPGITAIVGPNGCGKSNILDAVRWVLGEQSARALRGQEMSDLIFNGTETRKPLGMAEVSLTFSDCKEELGIDYSEITIGRRIFRDGTSEYELNGKTCRLKDIQALFMDTGIGLAGYSIMEQGKINQLLSAKPEDRREIFEEAAGITKFKTQKREALQKLQATETNLLRINDILKEVKRQISSIQRQATKARKYQEIFSELKFLEWAIAYQQISTLQKEADTIRELLNHKRTAIASHLSVLREIEKQTSQSQNDLQNTQRKLEQCRHQQISNQSARQRIQAEISIFKERLQHITTIDGIANNEVATLRERISQQQQSFEALQSQIQQDEIKISQLELSITEQQRAHSAAQDALNQTRQKLSQLRRELECLETERAQLVKNLAIYDSKRQSSKIQIQFLEHEKQSLNKKQQELEIAFQEKKNLLAQQEIQRSATFDNLRNLQQLADDCDKKLTDAITQRTAAERLLLETESRLQILEKLEQQQEGFSTGTQELLRCLVQGNIQIPHSGTLSDQIQIRSEDVLAIECLLQDTLGALVLDNPEDMWSLAHWWKKNQKNQRILLTAKNIPLQAKPINELPPESAVHAIQAPNELQPLITCLLGEALIADDLDQAKILSQNYPGRNIATRSGELLTSSGTLVLSGEAQFSKIFERRQLLTTLQKQREQQRISKQIADQNYENILTQLKDIKSKIDSSQESLRKIEHSIVETNAEILRIQNEISSAQNRLEQVTRQIQNLTESEPQSEELIAKQIARQNEINALCTELEQTIHQFSEALTQKEAEVSSKAVTLSELRIKHASTVEKHKSHLAQLTALQEQLSELNKNITEHEKRISENAERKTTIEQQITHLQKQLQLLEQESDELDNTLAMLTEQQSAILQQLQNTNQQERRLRKELSTLQEERAQLELQLEKIHLNQESITDRLTHRFHLTPEEIASGPSSIPEGEPQSWFQRATELNQLLERIGHVNLDTITEFEQLQAREKFLEEQLNDLTSSKEQLTKAIHQLNISTRKMFEDTLEKIKNNFQLTFSELFGGGKATLLLEDENDPLDSSIDIIAKPPGKEPKSITSLSGGEQTLTAFALLFAIYMVKPSPFCILDEMDAPLDESNIDRFINILRRFKNQSQFLLITHNKRTIAFADAIYGLTQEERGVSKVVSIRFLHDSKKTDSNQNTDFAVSPQSMFTNSAS